MLCLTKYFPQGSLSPKAPQGYRRDAAVPNAAIRTITAPGNSAFAAPVNSGSPLDVVIVALFIVGLDVEVATAATVWSNTGVVVYVMVSPANATLVKGRSSSSTTVALGNARRSDAGADGDKEARSKSPGARTLERGWVSRAFSGF